MATTDSLTRLAKAETVGAAQDAYATGLAQHGLSWTRQVSASACEVCKGLAGKTLPGSVSMYHHTGCTCTQSIVSTLRSDTELRRRTPSANPTSAVEDELQSLLADPLLEPEVKSRIREALATVRAERVGATETTGALISQEQYAALQPTSTWSEDKRGEILASLRQTEEGRVLADTLERFQDGGSIARLRTKIDKFLAGEEIDQTSRARAESLLNAIANAPELAPEKLYRGMTIKGTLDNVAAKYEVGGNIDLNLTSFTSDRSVAKRFQEMTAKGGRETRVMVELVGPGKKALPIQNLPKDRRLFREKEWVGAGRYEVVEVKKISGQLLLRIRQTGTVQP